MNSLHLWVVYDRPSDFPQSIVARLHVVRADGTYGPTEVLLRADSDSDYAEVRSSLLDAIRHCIRNHASWPMHHRFDRSPGDEPHIVETWF